MQEDCLFCRIIAGELPSTRVYEDERTIAIMDIFPAAAGHVLVMPREHSTDLHDIPSVDLFSCAATAQHLAGLAVKNLQAEGVTIMQSNGAAAWQTVFHYHVHVIPRYLGDPLVLPWTPGPQADPDELRSISQSYSQH
jgi:histidine triad (HIT) family protein